MGKRPAQADVDVLIGQTLAGRYLIEHRVGRGGMGTVYKARHVQVGRAFAVKVLHAETFDAMSLQRFEREAKLAGRLRHANAIGVVDAGEINGLRYMVMEFAEGPDLATVIRSAPLAAPRIIHLCRQLLEGLYHAHGVGLIHRDLKPENVIVEIDAHGVEVPRIVDFGVAILREAGSSTDSPGRLTGVGLVLGTPVFMAPEQTIGDPIDHRIDLFALGVIVYEMLSGKLPFDGSGADVARSNVLFEPPAIKTRVPSLDVDPLLEAFARRLMARNPANRPATAKVALDLIDLIATDRTAAAVALGVPLDAARAEPSATKAGNPVPELSLLPITVVNQTPMRGVAAVTVANRTPMPGVLMNAPRPSDLATTAMTVVAPPEQTVQTRRGRSWQTILGVAAGGVVAFGIVAAVIKGSDTRDRNAAPIALIAAPQIAPVDGTAPPFRGAAGRERAPALDAAGERAVPEAPAVVEHAITPPRPPVVRPVHRDRVMPPVVVAPRIDASALAAQFQTVGAELLALEQSKGSGSTSDLEPRFRLIRIVDAMSTQPKRDAATIVLARLHDDIAARTID